MERSESEDFTNVWIWYSNDMAGHVNISWGWRELHVFVMQMCKFTLCSHLVRSMCIKFTRLGIQSVKTAWQWYKGIRKIVMLFAILQYYHMHLICISYDFCSSFRFCGLGPGPRPVSQTDNCGSNDDLIWKDIKMAWRARAPTSQLAGARRCPCCPFGAWAQVAGPKMWKQYNRILVQLAGL